MREASQQVQDFDEQYYDDTDGEGVDDDEQDDSNLSDSENRDCDYGSEENSLSGSETSNQYCFNHSSSISECDDILSNYPSDIANQYY